MMLSIRVQFCRPTLSFSSIEPYLPVRCTPSHLFARHGTLPLTHVTMDVLCATLEHHVGRGGGAPAITLLQLLPG